jgi:hypothetical protein
MKNSALKLCAALAAFALADPANVRSQEPLPHFDVNDVAFLFPTPTADQVNNNELISGDDLLDDGSTTVWPQRFFKKVIDFAKDDAAAKANGSAIQFADGLEDLHNWKVAGIRVNPASLGGSKEMIEGLTKAIGASPELKAAIGAPIVPGIRLVMQPVTVKDGKVTFHDFAAHVVFNQKAVNTQEELKASDRMKLIVNDLIDLKKFAKNTDGIKLGEHPGFKVDGFRKKLGEFLKKQLKEEEFAVVSFMGLENPKAEPWIFFRVKRKGDTMEKTTIGSFPRDGATAMMLAVRKTPMVQPEPPSGVVTAPLLEDDVDVNAPMPHPPAQFKDTNLKLKDIPDFVANPKLANTFNTDCVSCHTETTRRLTLDLAGKAAPFLAFKLEDDKISGVSDTVSPGKVFGTSWNVRVFGWGPGKGKPTIVQRAANEAMESADFFNRVFFKK